MAGLGERFEMRLDSDLLERIDLWREKQGGGVARAGAIRELVETGLLARAKDRAPSLSDGEKLILMALADLNKPASHREIDLDFLQKVIVGGHYWALSWKMSGIFHDHIDQPESVSFVVRVLDMWSHVENAMERFDSEQKELIEKEAAPFGRNVKFNGFDGNNESELMSITMFLVEDMNRFSYLKDNRSFNSHFPAAAGYRKMLEGFEQIRSLLADRGLEPEQVVALLNMRRY